MTTTDLGVLMESEIREQPAVWAGLADQVPAILEAAAALRESTGALLIARGTSDHAALYGQYAVQRIVGKPATLATPSVIASTHELPVPAGFASIAISQSGQSPDLVSTLRAALAAGGVGIAITNDPTSPLAQAATVSIDLSAGPERAVAATKSYSTQVLALALLAHAWAGAGESELRVMAKTAGLAGEHALDASYAAGERIAAAIADADRMVAVGRGLSMASAKEAALKLMETSSIAASGWSAADANHGPLGQLIEGSPLLAFLGEEHLRPEVERAIAAAKERGAITIAVGAEDDEFPAHTDLEIAVVPAAAPAWLRPVVEIVVAQCTALHFSRARGLDPDKPKGLTKVTLTQ